jgi:type II restriction endonuclease EcoO109I-like protein
MKTSWFAVSLTSDQRERILTIFRSFLAKRLKNLEGLTLDKMTFNVIALRATATMLELADARALLQYRLAQRLERGSVTALGTALQAIAREIGGTATGVEGADIMLERDGRRYYIQVKSGPETFNKDIAQNIATQLNSARSRDPGAVCVAGVCYGRAEQISGMVRTQLANRGIELLVGGEFWATISGDPSCMNELLDLARAAAEEAPPGGLSFAEQVERKLDGLTADFQARYGAA